MRGSYLEFFFGVFNGTQTVTIAFQTNYHSLGALILARSSAKADNAIPAVCGGHNLHIVLLRGAKNQSPEFGLEIMVNAVLSFIDEKEPIGSIYKCHGYAEQASCTVTETSQGNSLTCRQLDDDPAAIVSARSGHNRYTLYSEVRREPEGA